MTVCTLLQSWRSFFLMSQTEMILAKKDIFLKNSGLTQYLHWHRTLCFTRSLLTGLCKIQSLEHQTGLPAQILGYRLDRGLFCSLSDPIHLPFSLQQTTLSRLAGSLGSFGQEALLEGTRWEQQTLSAGLSFKWVGSFQLSLSTKGKIAAAFCKDLNPISVHEAWPRNARWMQAEGCCLWMLAGRGAGAAVGVHRSKMTSTKKVFGLNTKAPTPLYTAARSFL